MQPVCERTITLTDAVGATTILMGAGSHTRQPLQLVRIEFFIAVFLHELCQLIIVHLSTELLVRRQILNGFHTGRSGAELVVPLPLCLRGRS